MKYTNYFRFMMFASLIFLGGAIEACLEMLLPLCACFSAISFSFWFSGIMAPDSEKYNKEYLKKYKGWN